MRGRVAEVAIASPSPAGAWILRNTETGDVNFASLPGTRALADLLCLRLQRPIVPDCVRVTDPRPGRLPPGGCLKLPMLKRTARSSGSVRRHLVVTYSTRGTGCSCRPHPRVADVEADERWPEGGGTLGVGDLPGRLGRVPAWSTGSALR
jgi:hypothetical protein